MLWLILGLIIGAGGWWLVSWTRARRLQVTWLEWLLLIVAVVFALLAIQNFAASLSELEEQAPWVLLILFGAPAVILAALAWLLVWRRQRTAGVQPKA
jgi:hypothetical protein